MSRSGDPWLPHGPEFRFVDQVLEHHPGRSVVGCLELGTPTARPAYSGALPGSYLLESMIQTCGLLFGEPAGAEQGASPLAMVVALDRVRWFVSPRQPGRVITRCRLVHRVGPFLRCRCEARGEGRELLASGEVTLRVGPRQAAQAE